MTTVHNLGFPRIGARRELKFALESFWKGDTDRTALRQTVAALRETHWRQQARLDFVPVGDFSCYDQVLDMSFTLGNVPERAGSLDDDDLDAYFRVARGRSPADRGAEGVAAGEMTKWFNTNYHYIVPEFHADTAFTLRPERLLSQIAEAVQLGHRPKPVIIGPLSYLWLGKAKDGSDRLALLERCLPVYAELLARLAGQGVEWVQIDEPILCTELDGAWRDAFGQAYQTLQDAPTKHLLTTYFGQLRENLPLVCELPVDGVHLDAISARDEVEALADGLAGDAVVSIGAVSGRNIWKPELDNVLDWLEPMHERLGERLWLAPSCSLLHVPVDLNSEQRLDGELCSWLAFALQKIEALTVLAEALKHGRDAVADTLASNAAALESRRRSARVHNPAVRSAAAAVSDDMERRRSSYAQRAPVQRAQLQLPAYPTTTIGSFPQTMEIRKARRQFRAGELSEDAYLSAMRKATAQCVHEQEALELDVLVHGEAERNDMVEYFGELMDGYAFSQFGWVQSYGSRCVKPPILFGDIARPAPMTVEWTRHAQSLTKKPMKGMLTGPVTMLNWSFVRDDQPRADTCMQLALAIRDEVLDLERASINVIQIDEPALREGMPLRRSQWRPCLAWAIKAFRVAANGVRDETQVHTHMCYAEFNDIIEHIADMDADVITIETSRSDMELLDVFDEFKYPNEIGPGVYDIHSPNTPDIDAMVMLMRKASERIPAERLWVNPDCGLKTRSWEEARPALSNMVQAAKAMRRAGAARVGAGQAAPEQSRS